MPRELWTRAGELGLLSNMVPEKYGGLGLDCKYPAIVWEEQAYSGCTGPGFAMHSDIVAPYITNYGTDEQKERMLPKLVRRRRRPLRSERAVVSHRRHASVPGVGRVDRRARDDRAVGGQRLCEHQDSREEGRIHSIAEH